MHSVQTFGLRGIGVGDEGEIPLRRRRSGSVPNVFISETRRASMLSNMTDSSGTEHVGGESGCSTSGGAGSGIQLAAGLSPQFVEADGRQRSRSVGARSKLLGRLRSGSRSKKDPGGGLDVSATGTFCRLTLF